MNLDAVIEVVDFKKQFGSKVVHNGVSFFVKKGECLGLLGGSGTGKSVLLRSLIGLERADSGDMYIEGKNITLLDEEGYIEVRKKVAYAFQDGALFDSMTVFENLAYPLREHTRLTPSEISHKILNQLSEFGLSGNEHVYPGNLSGGMQKRTGLARAMMMDPSIVLYDEPTAGLDPFNTKRIQESIINLKSKGVTSIIVTHDMPTALAVCEKIAFLKDGKIVEQVMVNEFNSESHSLIHKFMQGEKL